MDDPALAKLSPEQLAALSDDLKAVYLTMDETDRSFFARTFKPADLARALARKEEILKRNQAARARMDELKARFAASVEAHPPESDDSDAIAAAVTGALGLGAAAAVATDNTAHFRGVTPLDLVPALRSEFGGGKTSLQVGGREDALTATIGLWDGSQTVPAMTINMAEVDNGVEVKVNDLTSQGKLHTLKEGGKKLLGAAATGLGLFTGRKNPFQLIVRADEVINAGAGLAEAAGNLRLKERAWKVIKEAAENIEAGYLSKLKEERQARTALEMAWNHYYNCPSCGVSFQPQDDVCRVCGTARPSAPSLSDPRSL